MIPWHQHLLLRNSKDLVPEKLLEMKDVFQVLKKYFFHSHTPLSTQPSFFKLHISSNQKMWHFDQKLLYFFYTFSAVVTENEKAFLAASLPSSVVVDSPKPPPGFVKSMCKLYADWSPKRRSLNRSNSFSGPESSPPSLSNNEEETTTTPPQRKGSFRLFRSNSWSSRRNKNKSEVKTSPPKIENQRCSPSYSTKSQDSGFSEHGAAKEIGSTTTTASDNPAAPVVNTAQLIHNQRLQFLR